MSYIVFFESIPITNLSLFLSSRPLITAECRAARLLKFKTDRIRELQQQISAYTLNLNQARHKIAMLESQIAEEIETMAILHPLQCPSDRIFLDIACNRTRHPIGRRYSLAWSEEIQDISLRAWEYVRRVFPLPGDHLLLSKLADTRAVISSALLDFDKMEALIDLWERSHEDTMTDCRVIFSIDVIALCLIVTINDDGSVDGVKRFDPP
jgi:hypothetical protein